MKKQRGIHHTDLEDDNFRILFLGLILMHLATEQLIDVRRRIDRMICG